MKNLSIVILTLMSIATNFSCSTSKERVIEWDQLPALPDSTGFAGSFAGVSKGRLIVAGGANFPGDGRPWAGGIKTWYDKIFVLEGPDKAWKEVGRLPRAMGYGVSLTWKDQLLILGGADKDKHYAECYILSYDNDSVLFEDLPPLPAPNANASGAIIDDVVYVAGGLASPSAAETFNVFWSLDLSKPAADRQWQSLDTLPGPSRMLAVAGAWKNEFYLVSGVHLAVATGDSVARREYLSDAYVFSNAIGWRRIHDLPYPNAAAPTPAYADDQTGLLIMGGDDGSKAGSNATLKDNHPGFTKNIVRYINGEWSIFGEVKTIQKPDPEKNPNGSTWAPVTTPMVVWKGAIVIPGGEVRPGVRTTRVLRATLK